eukprot:g2574.t1
MVSPWDASANERELRFTIGNRGNRIKFAKRATEDAETDTTLGAQLGDIIQELRGEPGSGVQRNALTHMTISELEAELSPGQLTRLANDLMQSIKEGTATDVDESRSKAVALWRTAAQQGDKHARYSYAMCLRAGDGIVADPSTAMDELLSLACEGHPWAQFVVAIALRDGTDVERDSQRALELFQIAAANKVAPALLNIGNMLAKGIGLPGGEPDIPGAIAWYRKAADAGDPKAMWTLGQHYSQGLGVERDDNKAFEFHCRAADAGMGPLANFAVATHYLQGTGVQRDYERAAALYEQAANAGLTVAIVNLANMYLKGLGVDKNHERARELLHQAAPRDHNARMMLQEMDAQQV